MMVTKSGGWFDMVKIIPLSLYEYSTNLTCAQSNENLESLSKNVTPPPQSPISGDSSPASSPSVAHVNSKAVPTLTVIGIRLTSVADLELLLPLSPTSSSDTASTPSTQFSRSSEDEGADEESLEPDEVEPQDDHETESETEEKPSTELTKAERKQRSLKDRRRKTTKKIQRDTQKSLKKLEKEKRSAKRAKADKRREDDQDRST
jgi:hypothetical protein